MYKILVAEDEPFLVRIYKAKLEEQGYKVEILEDGLDVHVKAKDFQPDVIILDIVMSNKDGYEALQELKQDSSTKTIPVIFLTNMETDEAEIKSLSMGVDKFIRKSITVFKDVLDAIESVIKENK